MPIAACAFEAPVSAVSTLPLPVSCTPFHFDGGRPMAAPIIVSVPEVVVRMNIDIGSVQGVTWYMDPPKPNTTYAASALIEVSFEAFGTAMVIAWMGPWNSFSPCGTMIDGLQLPGYTSDTPTSTLMPVVVQAVAAPFIV